MNSSSESLPDLAIVDEAGKNLVVQGLETLVGNSVDLALITGWQQAMFVDGGEKSLDQVIDSAMAFMALEPICTALRNYRPG